MNTTNIATSRPDLTNLTSFPVHGPESIGPTGIWSAALAARAHRFDQPLADAIAALYGRPDRILADFGCGPGAYLRTLDGAFMCSVGYEGTPDYAGTPPGHAFEIVTADLANPYFLPPPADVALCLEVGEHLPSSAMHNLLDTITLNTRDWLILSWATPGQGGDGHLNEQPADHIEELLAERLFAIDQPHTQRLRSHATLPWFRQNLTAYRRTAVI